LSSYSKESYPVDIISVKKKKDVAALFGLKNGTITD
jgi:hypothetical protein